MIDPASIQVITTIIVALIGATASISVTYIQSSAKPHNKPVIILPDGTKIKPILKNMIGWIIFATLIGGLIGYIIGGSIKPTTLIPIPTNTNVPTSTNTSFPTLTLTPQPAVLFEDTFISNSNNWYTDNNSTIAGGKYTHKISCTNSDSFSYCANYFYIPFLKLKNFHIEVDATIVDSPSYVDVIIGFQIRRNGLNHYYIDYFINQGFYNLDLANNGDVSHVIGKTTTDIINQNVDTTNRFGIIVADTKFTPIINNQELLSGEDGNIINEGDIVLILFIAEGQTATVELDNLIIYEIK